MGPKYLLIEPIHGESRWLNEEEVVEVDIPDVKIPTEIPMKNYKWNPTFHGSLVPKKEPPKVEEQVIKKTSESNPCQEIYVLGQQSPVAFLANKDLELKAYAMPISKILLENSVKDWEEKEFLDFQTKVETVVQTSSSKTKTKPKKTVTKTPKKKPAPAIFQWTFQSSQDVGGQKAVYSTLLRSNGDMTCNCPGWIFKRGDDRFCKHTKMVEAEGKKLYKDHKTGKELPAMELVGAGNINVAANPKKESDLKYGRTIILD